MGTNSGIYKLLFLLHLLSVIGGIGSVMLNGLRMTQAKKIGGAGGVAVGRVVYDVTMVAEKLIYAIPVFGILMVLVSDGAIEFSDTWISLSLLLYIVAIGVSHGVMIPSARRYNELAAADGGPSVSADAQALEKRIAGADVALNLLVVALVALMIWKPGA